MEDSFMGKVGTPHFTIIDDVLYMDGFKNDLFKHKPIVW